MPYRIDLVQPAPEYQQNRLLEMHSPSRSGLGAVDARAIKRKPNGWRALMSKALKLINQIRKDEEGAALIEYTILLGIIAVAVIGFATAISGWITTQWSGLCAKLTGASC